MSTPKSPSHQSPSASFFDLVDIDFTETPPLSTTSTTFPTIPSPTNTTPRSPPVSSDGRRHWAPMVPDMMPKSVPALASLEVSGKVEEAIEDVEPVSAKEGESKTQEDDQTTQIVNAEEVNTKEPLPPAPASESGDIATAHLRPSATPFKSNSLRVAPASAPHSFFPDRADTNSHIASSPTSEATPEFFYGESDGYAGTGSAPVTTWTHSPPSLHPHLSPVAAAAFKPPPESKSIRISSPPAQNKPAPAAPAPRPQPSSPASAPDISLPGASPVGLAIDFLSGDDEMSIPADPVSHLVRSMSHISIAANRDILEPSQQAQDTLEELVESLEELNEMEKTWAEYRDAYGKFSGGIEEVIARLRFNLDGDSSDDLRAARQRIVSLEAQVRDLRSAKASKERTDKTKIDDLALLREEHAQQSEKCEALTKAATEAETKAKLAWTKLESLRERYDTLEGDRVHWHKRESELAKSFLDLEDQYSRTLVELSRLKKRIAAVEAPVKSSAVFSAVLIECTASVIDRTYIMRGVAGGKELGENILATVMPKEEGLVVAQIFLDFPEFKKRLMNGNIIKKESDLHNFFDGFRSVSGLFTVVDAEKPAIKIQDHMKLYTLLGASKIVLASRRSSPYRDVLSATDDRKGIFAVRGASEPDPFDFIGASNMMAIKGLMDDVPQSIDQTPRQTPLPTPRPVTPPPAPATVTKQTPPHLRSSSTAGTESTNGPLSPSSQASMTPQSELPPAPWAQVIKAEISKRPATRVAPTAQKPGAVVNWWEKGDTLRDQVVATDAGASEQFTPRAKPLTLALNVPVSSLASLGGSPADSDEDHPNVDLPHSAVKWVQRPIEFSQDTASSQRSRSDSVSSSKAPGSVRREPPINPARMPLLQQGGAVPVMRGSGAFRAPSITGSNDIPLGQAGKGGAGKLHGFNIHGRK